MHKNDTKFRVQFSILFKSLTVRARTNLSERKIKKTLSKQCCLRQ